MHLLVTMRSVPRWQLTIWYCHVNQPKNSMVKMVHNLVIAANVLIPSAERLLPPTYLLFPRQIMG